MQKALFIVILPATFTCHITYIMASNDDLSATEHDLKSLEIRIDELINTCIQLKAENSSLLSTQSELQTERETLIQKTELAKNRVENMINRLKSMEIHP